MMFIYLLLFVNLFATIRGDVNTFGLANGETPLADSKTTLRCVVSGTQTTYKILQSGIETPLTTCVVSTYKCKPSVGSGYKYAFSSSGVTIEIERLERTRDETRWTCMDENRNQKNYDLKVYNVPSGIALDGTPSTCDLGTSTCAFTCKTNGCTYPTPVFSWLYSNNNGDSVTPFPNLGQVTKDSQPSSCSSPAMFYQETLTLSRYTVFTGNIQTTIKLRCKMHIPNLSSETRISDFSRDVVFAFKVSTVNITDGGINLPDGQLSVIKNEAKSLTCIPGNGHPDSTVTWYIGETAMSTGREYGFDPLNSFHGQQIYCVADNIPSNGIPDAVSSKHTLFVTVKTQYAYIKPAENNVLSVVENTPEPVVCISSPGRPRTIIKWFKQNTDIGEGNHTNFELKANKLEVTKSTRYFRISRDDSDWELSCSASNFEGSARIEANNSKSFNVLYPPEHMRLLFAGKPVFGSTIDVIKGIPAILKCEAASNPPAILFSWNINQKVGDTLTIDDSIQNGQIVNCTARNSMTSTADITITGFGSISKKLNIQYGPLIKQIVVNGKADPILEFKENDQILIGCNVDSNPASTISLFQGDNLLKKKQQSTVLTFDIPSAQCSHTSQYICKADNGIDNVQEPAMKTVQINVKCSPRLAFNTEPSIFAQENTSAVLSVTVLAYPIPTEYGWHRNTSNTWEELSNSTSVQITHSSLQFNLTIWSVKPGDYGEYKLTVDNTFSFIFFLKAEGGPEPHTNEQDDGSSATAGIIGGVVVGLLLVSCAIVIVVCILRRRNSLDDIKTKLFGRKSSASREEIQPQETGYSYAAVQKPTEGTALNIIDNTSTERKLDGESTPVSGYLYSEVNKGGRDNPITIVQELTGGKNKEKKTKAAPATTNEGPCYENPTLLTESDAKAKPQKKGKSTKQTDKKPVSQNHDGLQYVELSFSDTKKKGKKNKPAQPKDDERTVYDAVQFGVVGAAYTSNGEENNSKN